MAMAEGTRESDSAGLPPEYFAFEASIAIAEHQVEWLERMYDAAAESKARFESLDDRLDENHIQIMETRPRLELTRMNRILERMARVESKLQHVA